MPAYPPRPREGFERILRIAADCGAACVLTTAEGARSVPSGEAALGGLPVIATDTISAEIAEAWVAPKTTPASVAFLQYTSGSTGTPKGVQVSHANIIANQDMIRQGFGHSDETIFVGWLPLHHDMGLVGNVLQPLYLGIPCILMAPETFIQKPVRWLRAISRYRATTSGGPNFGYELCARRVSDQEIESLDLSTWQVAFNGAEPISADTLERFSRRFAACGFRPTTMYPCYGMAEATLFVTGGSPEAEPVTLDVDATALGAHWIELCSDDAPKLSRRRLIGCGRSWLDERVVVADPETRVPCGSDRVGEIWIAGRNVSPGYLKRPELNLDTFGGYLANGDGPFLRTGDLGFLRDGELFVTGRLKDLIILQGRNLYPQDIESTASAASPLFRAGGTAALTVEVDGTEQLIVVQEIDDGQGKVVDAAAQAELTRALRRAVADAHGVNVYTCLFVPGGFMPKTSSGKVRRRACVVLFESNGVTRPRSAWLEAPPGSTL